MIISMFMKRVVPLSDRCHQSEEGTVHGTSDEGHRARANSERKEPCHGKKEPWIAHMTHASHTRQFATVAHVALMYGTYACDVRRKRERSLHAPKLRRSMEEIATEA